MLHSHKLSVFIKQTTTNLDVFLATPLWLLKMTFFFYLLHFRHSFCIDLVLNSYFFKTINTNLEHPVLLYPGHFWFSYAPPPHTHTPPQAHYFLRHIITFCIAPFSHFSEININGHEGMWVAILVQTKTNWQNL